VVDAGAAVGLAFDGDADRVVAVDERGAVVDGDHLIAMCAIDRHARGQLRHGAVVVTVMTNLGFRLAMAERDIEVVETPVGDRAVLDALDDRDLVLGGEQSGHIIFRELATTGDGLLTGVQLLDLLVRSGRPLSALAADAMTRLPQVLRSVEVTERDPGLVPAIDDDIRAVTEELGPRGRVLVRPSGTEPVVRVMVEAPDEAQAVAAADRLVAALERGGAATRR
jgi:phosphoglucosamine mutase